MANLVLDMYSAGPRRQIEPGMLEFVDAATPRSPEQLDELARDQLRLVGIRFDGRDRSVESRFRDEFFEDDDDDDDDKWDDGNLSAHCLVTWRVVEAGNPRYDVWLHHADSGCVFVHGTTTIVAERCQFQWMVPGLAGPSELAPALDEALDRAEALARGQADE
jgi:hypothetical protein